MPWSVLQCMVRSENSFKTGMQSFMNSYQATGDLHPLNELPERCMSPSRCLVCLQTQRRFVSPRD